MPWHIEERDDEFCVVNDDTEADEGCHASRADAMEQIADLYAAEAERERGDDGEEAASTNGRPFTAMLAVEGLETSDGRYFEVDSLTWRNPPLPLMVQDTQPQWGGHEGAWYAGAIDEVFRDPDEPTRIMARGRLLLNAEGARAAELIEGGLRGVSVDASASDVLYDVRKIDVDGWPIDVLSRFQDGRIMGATVTPFPAFEEAVVWLDSQEQPAHVDATAGEDVPRTEEPEVIDDGLDSGFPFFALVASGGGPARPPREWFDDPQLAGPTALTITDEGRVFGHIYEWGTCHIGHLPACVQAPPSASQYAYFHTGVVTCDDGSRVGVGQITCGTGHAAARGVTSREAVAHYDDTGWAAMDVRAGEDDHGIWIAGALRPGLDEARLRAVEASAPSGDWRWISGSLELVAVLQVNVPGFPVPRGEESLAASAGLAPTSMPVVHMVDGECMALVAAANPALTRARQRAGNAEAPTSSMSRLERRVALLEASLKPLWPLAVEALAARRDARGGGGS